MLSVKPWKPDAIVRLLLGVFVCIYAGSLVLSAVRCAGLGGKTAGRFFPVAAVAWCFLGATLFLIRKPWSFEAVGRRMMLLLGCFYSGLLLGFWAEKLAGTPPANGSVGQMIVSTLSFQGAALVLLGWFIREHQARWREAFGFGNHWRRAVLIGLMVACIFLPVGWWLQQLSAELMVHLPRLHLKPEMQAPVRVLQMAGSWPDRLVLGVITILLAPVAEEALFRGVLYPAIKQAGFPRLALWGTALLFAAVHVNLATFAPLFVLALVLTVLYERTDNLLAPIVAHSTFNASNFTLLYLWERQLG